MGKKEDSLVLVTGASGYIAIHCVQQLLQQGYKVRGTVRSLKNEQKITPIRNVWPEGKDRLELVEADLLDEGAWTEAVKGCDYVLHLASPFVTDKVTDEQVLIKPAVEGTLAVLRACAATKGKVKRVVLTSSIASILFGYTNEAEKTVFSEKDWTRPEGPDVSPYIKSKYLAERAAWDYVATLKGEEAFELVVMNPAFVFGPQLHNVEGATAGMIKRLTQGGLAMPMVPKVMFPCIDVRDVAKAHIRGMEIEEAKGQRFLLGCQPSWFKEISQALAEELGDQGYSPPWMEAPGPMLKLVGLMDSSIKDIAPRSGYQYTIDNSKMLNVLKIDPIPMETSVVDMAYSLIDRGIIPKSRKFRGNPEGRGLVGTTPS